MSRSSRVQEEFAAENPLAWVTLRLGPMPALQTHPLPHQRFAGPKFPLINQDKMRGVHKASGCRRMGGPLGAVKPQTWEYWLQVPG